MVSIICCTMRMDYMENVFENYENQDWEEKELIIILNRDDMDVNPWKERAKQSKSVTTYQLPEQLTLGACLNYGIKKSKYRLLRNLMMTIIMQGTISPEMLFLFAPLFAPIIIKFLKFPRNWDI
jgi:hypothetical protein